MNLLPKLPALLILSIIFISCKKNNPTPDNNIYWKVNGVAKSAKPDASYFDNNTFMLEATSGNDYINLSIDRAYRVGTFHLDNPFEMGLIEYKIGKNEDYYADNGTLVITRDDGDNIQGTFSFNVGSGSSKKEITEGSFNAKLHFYSTTDTSYYSDTLFNKMKTKRLALHNQKKIH
jgi:hypothetical protein